MNSIILVIVNLIFICILLYGCDTLNKKLNVFEIRMSTNEFIYETKLNVLEDTLIQHIIEKYEQDTKYNLLTQEYFKQVMDKLKENHINEIKNTITQLNYKITSNTYKIDEHTNTLIHINRKLNAITNDIEGIKDKIAEFENTLVTNEDFEETFNILTKYYKTITLSTEDDKNYSDVIVPLVNLVIEHNETVLMSHSYVSDPENVHIKNYELHRLSQNNIPPKMHLYLIRINRKYYKCQYDKYDVVTNTNYGFTSYPINHPLLFEPHGHAPFTQRAPANAPVGIFINKRVVKLVDYGGQLFL